MFATKIGKWINLVSDIFSTCFFYKHRVNPTWASDMFNIFQIWASKYAYSYAYFLWYIHKNFAPLAQWKLCFILSRFQKSRLNLRFSGSLKKQEHVIDLLFSNQCLNFSLEEISIFKNFSIWASAICLSIWTICLFFLKTSLWYAYKWYAYKISVLWSNEPAPFSFKWNFGKTFFFDFSKIIHPLH